LLGGVGGLGGAGAFFHVYASQEQSAGYDQKQDSGYSGAGVYEGCGQDVQDGTDY